MKILNLTPHPLSIAGLGTIEPDGPAARVKISFSPFNADIENLPAPAQGTRYIVSGLVLSAAKAAGRTDCVAPATGHPDVVRDKQGHIVSVPGFVA